ncbi:hypothetical protein [Methylobacterium isbiliense]|jgi:hypothetical protein|uniref:Uncharacterized protein n=1 Tax=Methylobacterium isbiliense TaxID=315478 RepID=A0ABQ4SNA9_9HYPH|nr:hypothetical protein [Methylobacterium isbiliense]MDN3622312.1 hypothetical protein [Methylobacterium isbiliense]GJE03305.1 hypothetical protein GMJLKIPL_5259 [Methylobacterium isbiliense]
MRRILAVLGTLGPLVLAAPVLAGETAATSGVEKTFLIPSSDGYGVAECLSIGAGECGQVVADAWCESQGYARAASFGTAAQDEYTGAIDAPPVARAADRPIRITCRD